MPIDRDTMKRLQAFGKSIPPDLLKRGVVKKQIYAEEKAQLEEAARKGKTLAERRLAARALADEKVYNSLNRETTEIDPAVQAEMERRGDAFIRREMKAGRLKKLDKNDPFLRSLQKNFNRKP